MIEFIMKFLTATLVLLLQSKPRTVGGAFASTIKSYQPLHIPFLRGGSSTSSSFMTSSSSSSSSISSPATTPDVSIPIHPSSVGIPPIEDPGSQDLLVLQAQVNEAAMASLPIVGSNLFVDVFASTLPFINTSQLTKNKQHRVLFILGGPGAGKGTQCANIVDTYKCVHLSVGELLRQERLKGDASPHAELIETCLVSGQIVPVDISLSLVRRAMDDITTPSHDDTTTMEEETSQPHHPSYGQPIFLIDGFPRNFDNLQGWVQQMSLYASVLGALIYDCPMNVLEERILTRAETSGRSDDNIASARKRFATFQEQTMPVVQALEQVQKTLYHHYHQSNNNIPMIHQQHPGKSLLEVQHIAADHTMDQVWTQTQKVMNSYIQNDILTANTLLLKAIQDGDIQTYATLCSKEFLNLEVETLNKSTTSKGHGSFVDHVDMEKRRIQHIFQKYEMIQDIPMKYHVLSNPSISMQGGTKAVVTYDRCIYGVHDTIVDSFRETRVWSHEEKGWVCLHFSRKPFE